MASREIRIVARALTSTSERIVKRLALNVNAELIKRTPVDTGWARANWVPNIGGPYTETAGTRAQAEEGNIDLGPQQLGLAQIATTYKLGPEIHQTNNVPYIRRLNNGSSRQAGARFVQAAILRAIRKTAAKTR